MKLTKVLPLGTNTGLTVPLTFTASRNTGYAAKNNCLERFLIQYVQISSDQVDYKKKMEAFTQNYYSVYLFENILKNTNG